MLTRIVNSDFVHGTIWAKIDGWLIIARQKPLASFTGLHFYYFIYSAFISIRPLVSENLLFALFPPCFIPFSRVILYIWRGKNLSHLLILRSSACLITSRQQKRGRSDTLAFAVGLPYNQVICEGNDVLVASAAMVPFISVGSSLYLCLTFLFSQFV